MKLDLNEKIIAATVFFLTSMKTIKKCWKL